MFFGYLSEFEKLEKSHFNLIFFINKIPGHGWSFIQVIQFMQSTIEEE